MTFGYADRFDEKYDLVRSVRKGNMKYMRSYQPFNPDARLKKILTDAVAIGNAYARVNTVYPKDPGHWIYKDKHTEWVMAYPEKDTYFLKDGARRMDGRLWMHYNAVCVTPAMALTRPGAGSDYMITGLDSEGRPLDGAKTYKLHLPPDFPVKCRLGSPQRYRLPVRPIGDHARRGFVEAAKTKRNLVGDRDRDTDRADFHDGHRQRPSEHRLPVGDFRDHVRHQGNDQHPSQRHGSQRFDALLTHGIHTGGAMRRPFFVETSVPVRLSGHA